MFENTSHDFGTVARGSKQEFSYALKNIYKETVHIHSVRSSCGCTTPGITKKELATYEKGAITAKFNTGSFLGHKMATLTVVIDKPFYAEVQLTSQGYIRSDVVLSPNAVELGSVDQGSAVQQKMTIKYAGRSTWKILDVRSANPAIEVQLREVSRSGGRVSYEMTTRLTENASAGYINDQLILVTNDSRAKQIPIAVEGRVVPALTVSPASLFLGVVEPGDSVTKQIVVRGKQPFKVTCVDCDDAEGFQFDTSKEAKPLHLIPVTFTAGEVTGKVVQTIKIETDLGTGASGKCVASATIKPSERPNPPAEQMPPPAAPDAPDAPLATRASL